MLFGNPIRGRMGPYGGAPDPSSGFRVTRPFADESMPQYGPHDGLDIGNGKTGADVLAMASGSVYQSFFDAASGGAGIIRIDHGNGWTTGYAHLDQLGVGVGAKVSKGQRIGRLDNTGYSTAAHLHFDTTEGSRRRDPWPLLEQNAAGGEQDVDILGAFDRTAYGERFMADAIDGLAAMHSEPTAESPTLANYPNGTAIPGTLIMSSQDAQWYVAILYVEGRGNYCLGYIHSKDIAKQPAPAPAPDPDPAPVDPCADSYAALERQRATAILAVLVFGVLVLLAIVAVRMLA